MLFKFCSPLLGILDEFCVCVCVIFWMRVRWVRSGCKNEEVDNGVDDGDWFIELIVC